MDYFFLINTVNVDGKLARERDAVPPDSFVFSVNELFCSYLAVAELVSGVVGALQQFFTKL